MFRVFWLVGGHVYNRRIIHGIIKCFTVLVNEILVLHLKISISVEFGMTIVNSFITAAKDATLG